MGDAENPASTLQTSNEGLGAYYNWQSVCCVTKELGIFSSDVLHYYTLSYPPRVDTDRYQHCSTMLKLLNSRFLNRSFVRNAHSGLVGDSQASLPNAPVRWSVRFLARACPYLDVCVMSTIWLLDKSTKRIYSHSVRGVRVVFKQTEGRLEFDCHCQSRIPTLTDNRRSDRKVFTSTLQMYVRLSLCWIFVWRK